jgi:peptide subunit release factor 1 (eRF1)
MLDRLLGRASLKAKIDELSEERDSLAAQLEAESDRRREAARKRQEAEERVNRLEDRIEELEDRVGRANEDDGPTIRGTETLGPNRLETILRRLRSLDAGAEGALSAMVADGEELPEAVADAFGDRSGLVRRVAPALVYRDDAGLVSAAVEPPLPPGTFWTWDDSFRVEESWFRPTGRFAFALVRSDTFALGVYEDDERVSFEGFDSDVTDEHDKGGFSQARFERRREEEIDAHLDRCAESLADLDREELDRVILVGEKTVLSDLDVEADHRESADATGHDEDALDRAFRDFWTTTLTLL